MFQWNENILPLPSHNFSVDADFGTIRTKMETGIARQRNRFSQPIKAYSVRWELNRFQMAVFAAVFESKLKNGEDWFLIRLPLDNDESLTETVVRFAGAFKRNHRAFENYEVSATLELKDGKTQITADILDLITDYTEAELQAIQDAANSFIDNN